MKFDIKRILPKDISNFESFRVVRLAVALYMLVIVVRSSIHLIAPDGGAQSIAGVDTSIEGGNNIIAMFHQWGAVQLILVTLLFVLFYRYPGLTPLILITLALDPVMRSVAGQFQHLTTVGVPPGEIFNWAAFSLLILLLIASLFNKRVP